MTDSNQKIERKQLSAMRVICAFLVGLGTGVLTVIGQKYLPGSWNSLANSGAVWLIPAFFTAMWGKKMAWAIVLCIESLIVCVFAYYGFEAMLNNHAFEFGGLAYLWLVCAFAFGAVFGVGAFLFSRKKWCYHWGAGLLPAVFLSEGVIELIHLPDYAHMIPAVIGRIVMGMALYLIIFRHELFSRKSLISLGVLSLLGLVGFELIFRMT